MVFIHGGGYILGSSATPIYDGAALARKGCVYVSVNYRLGALGCLDLSSLSTPEHPIDGQPVPARPGDGAALGARQHRGVRRRPGQRDDLRRKCAGAQAVATLLAVPQAKGLFAQAISESPASGMVRHAGGRRKFADQFAGLLGRKHDAAPR